jgi:hypothetical protein
MYRFLPAAALSLAFLSPAAHAADPRLLIPVTFDPAAEVPDAVKNECGLDYKLQEEAAHQLKGRDKAWEPTETLEGRVVRLTILGVKAGAAGAMSGPKSITARVELLNEGKVERSKVLHVSSFSVPMLTFKSTCTILDKASRGLAKHVAEWTRNPDKAFKDDPEAGNAVVEAPTNGSDVQPGPAAASGATGGNQ